MNRDKTLATAEHEGERRARSDQRREATDSALIEAQKHEAMSRLLPLLQAGVQDLARLLPDDVRVSSELHEPPLVSINQVQIQQVVLNLVHTARDAMPQGGRLVVAVRPLPASHEAATPGPAWTSERAPHRSSAGPPRPARRASVLVVEDDDVVRELIVVALRSHGHGVREAAGGDQAMQMLAEPGVHDDLLCIDGVLPGAPAATITKRFRVVRPGCPVLVCSGNLGTPQLQALVQDERLPFLPKPFMPAELAAKVAELLVSRTPTRD